MIIGIGSDLVDIRRIEKVLIRHGARFTKRCFTETECRKAEGSTGAGGRASAYAKRFAAKEAAAKALGSGINHGVYLREIGVENNENGAPVLKLTGGALQRLQALMPEGKSPHIHLTLSDEPPLAQAFVIIEARP